MPRLMLVLLVLLATPSLAAQSCTPRWNADLRPWSDSPYGGDFVLAEFQGSLYAGSSGGYFDLQRWNGAAWSPVTAFGSVNATSHPRIQAMMPHDDGSGPKLWVAGTFSVAGSGVGARVLTFDGSQWSTIAVGITVEAFGSHSGSLYVGVRNHPAGGARVARWTGTDFVALPGTFDTTYAPTFHSIQSFSGALFVGGAFQAPGSHLVVYQPSNPLGWGRVGSTGPNGAVRRMLVHDDGSGAALYLCGAFSWVDQVAAAGVARWNGSWSTLGSGLGVGSGGLSTITHYPGSTYSGLYVGGHITSAGGAPTNGIARWSQGSWQPAGEPDSNVSALLSVFDGQDWTLHAAGGFSRIGDCDSPGVAAFSVGRWQPLGLGPSSLVGAATSFDFGDGRGPAVYLGGRFTTIGGASCWRVARWLGPRAEPLGSGIGTGHQSSGDNSYVAALCGGVVAGTRRLFAAGSFDRAGGQVATTIAQWDGTNWSAVGAGLPAFSGGTVPYLSLAIGDGRLYAAADHTAHYVREWNGVTWRSLPLPVSGRGVTALAWFGDGVGAALHAGVASPSGQGGVFRWNGSVWLPVGSLPTGASAFVAHPIGGSEQLIAGSYFGGLHAWSGASWVSIGAYPCDGSLASFDDGSGIGPGLFATIRDLAGPGIWSLARYNGTSWAAMPDAHGTRCTATAIDRREILPSLVLAGTIVGGSPPTVSGTPSLAQWLGCRAPTPLRAEPDTLDPLRGGTQVFGLDASPARGRLGYWVLGSFSGTHPGFNVGNAHLAINLDALTLAGATNPNLSPYIGNLGTLDDLGRARPAFSLPPGLGFLSGLDANHLFVTFDPNTLRIESVSNVVTLHLR